MDTTAALIEAWDRQARIVDDIAALVNESNRKQLPGEDSWPLDFQLAHIHGTRRYWLSKIDPERAKALGNSYLEDWSGPIEDLDAIRGMLKESAKAVREVFENGVKTGEAGPYDHPVLFMQHMVWHEGWHVGLIILGLRTAGVEPGEEWQDEHMWQPWRGVEVWEEE